MEIESRRVQPADNDVKLKRTLAGVFDLPPDAIADDDSMDTIAAWDSLAHLRLILALEEAFQISLGEQEAFEILSVPLIKTVLEEHGIEFGV